MPRFFVDLDDGAVRISDEEGIEARDLDEAKAKVLAALPQMASDALPEHENLTIAANVRDANGRLSLTAILKVEVSRHA